MNSAATIVRRELKRQAPLLAVMLAYIGSGYGVAWWFELQHKHSLTLYSRTFLWGLLGAVWLLAIVFLVRALAVTRPPRLFPYLRNELTGRYLTIERLCAILPVVLLTGPFFSTFTSLKLMIPDLHPFAWDATFARWDAAVHGGVQPWRILQPLLGFPPATTVMNILYYLWFALLYGGLIWQLLAFRDRTLRDRFLLSFVSVWILLGTVGAIALSSAGPCFYGRLVAGENPYADLMNYLRVAQEVSPVWVLDTQQKLWTEYVTGQRVLGAGISAMPSLHIGISWLLALVGWRVRRWLGAALSFYCLVLLVSSVHLAWHYAIDGYAAIIATTIIWRVAGRYAIADVAPVGGAVTA
jgi:hypothetical protein